MSNYKSPKKKHKRSLSCAGDSRVQLKSDAILKKRMKPAYKKYTEQWVKNFINELQTERYPKYKFEIKLHKCLHIANKVVDITIHNAKSKDTYTNLYLEESNQLESKQRINSVQKSVYDITISNAVVRNKEDMNICEVVSAVTVLKPKDTIELQENVLSVIAKAPSFINKSEDIILHMKIKKSPLLNEKNINIQQNVNELSIKGSNKNNINKKQLLSVQGNIHLITINSFKKMCKQENQNSKSIVKIGDTQIENEKLIVERPKHRRAKPKSNSGLLDSPKDCKKTNKYQKFINKHNAENKDKGVQTNHESIMEKYKKVRGRNRVLSSIGYNITQRFSYKEPLNNHKPNENCLPTKKYETLNKEASIQKNTLSVIGKEKLKKLIKSSWLLDEPIMECGNDKQTARPSFNSIYNY